MIKSFKNTILHATSEKVCYFAYMYLNALACKA